MTSYSASSGKFRLLYDDGDVEALKLEVDESKRREGDAVWRWLEAESDREGEGEGDVKEDADGAGQDEPVAEPAVPAIPAAAEAEEKEELLPEEDVLLAPPAMLPAEPEPPC